MSPKASDVSRVTWLATSDLSPKSNPHPQLTLGSDVSYLRSPQKIWMVDTHFFIHTKGRCTVKLLVESFTHIGKVIDCSSNWSSVPYQYHKVGSG